MPEEPMTLEPSTRRRTGPIIAVLLFLLMLLGTALVLWMIHVTSAELVRDLDSPDTQTVSESLDVLTNRHDPAGLQKAADLLHAHDSAVWLSAALYLGSFGKTESVPYLIRGLRLTSPAHSRITPELTALTAQSFPDTYAPWHRWWVASHPNDFFRFDNDLAPSTSASP